MLLYSTYITLFQEHEFLAMQQTEFEKFYKQTIDLHRQKMFEMEMQFLESKHERKRGMPNLILLLFSLLLLIQTTHREISQYTHSSQLAVLKSLSVALDQHVALKTVLKYASNNMETHRTDNEW